MPLFAHPDQNGSDCKTLCSPTVRERQRRSGMTSNGTWSKFTVIFAAALLFLGGQLAPAAEKNSTVQRVVQDAPGKTGNSAYVKMEKKQHQLKLPVLIP